MIPEPGLMVVCADKKVYCVSEQEKILLPRTGHHFTNHHGQLYGVIEGRIMVSGKYGKEIKDVSYIDNIITGERVAEREGWIGTVVSHQGQLYDGGMKGVVYETLTSKPVANRASYVESVTKLRSPSRLSSYDEITGKPLFEPVRGIGALVSHEGELYDAGRYGVVFKTFTGEKIADREDWISLLISHNHELYDSGGYGLYNTFSGAVLVEGTLSGVVCVSFKGKLYYADRMSVYEADSGQRVAERARGVGPFAVHQGELYDGGNRAIHRTLHDPGGSKPLHTFSNYVAEVTSIPFSLWEALARTGKKVE